PGLESAMKDADAGIRLKVVHVGVSMSSGSAAALPLLREALRDAVVDVRGSALKGLSQLKGADSEAAGELGRLLADSNPVIRQDAIRALGNLGKAGMPGLLNALGDSYSALSDEAAKAIVRSGEDAVPSLQALHQSPDPHLRRIADQLLRRIQKKSRRRHE